MTKKNKNDGMIRVIITSTPNGEEEEVCFTEDFDRPNAKIVFEDTLNRMTFTAMGIRHLTDPELIQAALNNCEAMRIELMSLYERKGKMPLEENLSRRRVAEDVKKTMIEHL